MDREVQGGGWDSKVGKGSRTVRQDESAGSFLVDYFTKSGTFQGLAMEWGASTGQRPRVLPPPY